MFAVNYRGYTAKSKTMKKITGLVAVLMALSAVVNAQDNGKFRFGFKVEPNVSWMSPKEKDIESTGSSLRFSYGMNADIMFTDNYAVGTGLSIMSNGGEIEYLRLYNNTDGEFITKTIRDYNMKYVEIPLTLKLRTNEIGYMTYWFQFGLGLGVNIDARADEEIEFLYQLTDTGWSAGSESEGVVLPERILNDKEPIGSEARTFRTSLIIAAGVEYNLSGSTGIVGGITFNNGFSNVVKKSGVSQDDKGNPIFSEGNPQTFDLRAISNHLGFTVGILF
jgi:hypothetical protein